jgi:hypothetical protein
MSEEEKRENLKKVITSKIEGKRKHQNIEPMSTFSPEQSGNDASFEEQLEHNLTRTTNGEGSWSELDQLSIPQLKRFSRHLNS